MLTMIEVVLNQPNLGSKKMRNHLKKGKKKLIPESVRLKKDTDSKIVKRTRMFVEMVAFETGKHTVFIKPQILGDDVLKKYQRIRQKIELDDLFNEMQELTVTPVDNMVKLCEGVHDKENDLKYLVEMFEYQDKDGWNNHILKCKYQMDMDAYDFLYANVMMSSELRKKFDNNVSIIDFIYYFEENGVVYYFSRFCTKRILIFKGKECIKAGAFKRLPDGSVLEVYKTYDDPNYKDSGMFDRMSIKKGGAHFVPYKVGDKTYWDVNVYQDFFSGGQVRLRLYKSFMSSYFKKVITQQFDHIVKYVDEEKRLWKLILKKYPKIESTN